MLYAPVHFGGVGILVGLDREPFPSLGMEAKHIPVEPIGRMRAIGFGKLSHADEPDSQFGMLGHAVGWPKSLSEDPLVECRDDPDASGMGTSTKIILGARTPEKVRAVGVIPRPRRHEPLDELSRGSATGDAR